MDHMEPDSEDIKMPERSLRWHVLGGNNKHRIGMNANLCVYEETDADGKKIKKALLFDIGVLIADTKRPEDPALGECDTVIPDMANFLRKKDDASHAPKTPIDAIFLTHNHVDHLGALPFLLLLGYELPKIYATPYTAKRLEQELSNAGLDPSEWPQIFSIAPGKPVIEGPVSVTAFWVSHSTPQSVGFLVETPEGNVLNPGDFKLDQTVVWGPAFNEQQFNRLISGKEIDLLLLDSTGADRDITPTTEHDVRETLRDLMALHPDKRFVVAVMGGFEENLASVAMVAAEHKKTLWVSGWSHEQSLHALKQTGLSLSDHIGQPVDIKVLSGGKAARELAEEKPEKSVVVVTGAQGQPSAALSRALEGKHGSLNLDPEKDIILFCAPSVPGNEGQRERLLATFRQKGFKVLTRHDAPLYSQAHARLPELIEMVKMVKAKLIVPIHGDKNLRDHCATAMEKLGEKVLDADNGDVLKVSKQGIQSVSPLTKGRPKLIGFKTLEGTGWQDRHYLMTKAPQEWPFPSSDAANTNTKKRPKIFDIGKK